MKRVILIFALLLTAVQLYAQPDVIKQTYHYATQNGEELYLDRYYVEGVSHEPRPCMIFAFGGGFARGERFRDYYYPYFVSLARAGIDAVSIDYRLGLKNITQKLSIKEMIDVLDNSVLIAVEDMYAATNFVLARAEEWGIDPNYIMVSGSSAGAITALQAEYLRAKGAETAKVLPAGFRYAGVVSCAGALFSRHGRPRMKGEPAPMLLFHGTSDSNVPYDKASIMGVGFYGSRYIAKQLDRLDSPYLFYSVEYMDHRLAGTPLYQQCDLILQFIKEYVLQDNTLRTHTTVENIEGKRRPTRFTVRDYLRTNYQQ